MPAVEQTSHQRQLGINFNRILSYRWHVQTALKVQERPVSLEHYGCNGYRTLPPLPTVSAEYGVQCHRLWTRPHNNGKDKSVKAKCSAEWGNENYVKSQQARNAHDHLQISLLTAKICLSHAFPLLLPSLFLPPLDLGCNTTRRRKKRV